MTAQWLDGKRLAQTMQTALRADIAKLSSRPTLAALLVGEDPSAAAYIKSQARLAQSLGLTWLSQSLPSTATQQQTEAQIDAWNRDRSVHAIFIQTPLPKGIDAPRLISRLDPLKDVEGLAPKSPLLPCTALAAIALIEKVAGKARKRHRRAASLYTQARVLRLRATRAIAADADAYLRVVNASRRHDRRSLMHALRNAARVPQDVARDAKALSRLSQRLLAISSPVWRSDVECAHDLALASERASLGFVRANQQYLRSVRAR